jgi:hypothetical protein
MSVTIARAILLSVSLLTGFPIFAVCGMLFSFFLMLAGVKQIIDGSLLHGSQILIVSSAAFCGVFTLSNLVIHFWRTPFQNPVGANARKYGIGLLLGWMVMPVFLFNVLNTGSEMIMGSVLLIPVAVMVTLFWLSNKYHHRQ